VFTHLFLGNSLAESVPAPNELQIPHLSGVFSDDILRVICFSAIRLPRLAID